MGISKVRKGIGNKLREKWRGNGKWEENGKDGEKRKQMKGKGMERKSGEDSRKNGRCEKVVPRGKGVRREIRRRAENIGRQLGEDIFQNLNTVSTLFE